MIVTSHQKGWKITNQRSHGLLAAMLAYQYDIDLPNDVIVPAIIAIAEHDDGVEETKENRNLTEMGAPRHFMVSDEASKPDFTQRLNVMEISSSKSQLNALLTSFHVDFLHNGEQRKTDKDLDSFLTQQEKLRAVILKDLKINKKCANRLYRLMEWCDAFSLLICMDKIQPKGLKIEVSKSPDGDMNQTFYTPNNEISVEPWCFKNDKFMVFYEYKIIEQLKFDTIEEFDAVCKSTPVQREEFTFCKL